MRCLLSLALHALRCYAAFVRKLPGKLSPAWAKPGYALQPSDREFLAMLSDLRRLVGSHSLPELLGLPVQTVVSWQNGQRLPASHGRRLVWLTWALLLHPDRIGTAFDLATWGRFRAERRAVPEDWSI